MYARVWRMRRQGLSIDRETLRKQRPLTGELHFRLRISGRHPRWDVYLATLEYREAYVIPCLDQARLLEVRGRWLLFEGVEVVPRGRAWKNHRSDHFPQEWWCCLSALTVQPPTKGV